MHGSAMVCAAQENGSTAQTEFHASSPVTDTMQQEWALVEAHNYPAAERQLAEYVKAHPNSADAHFLLGYVYYREQRPKDSLAEYTTGAELRNPNANDLAVVSMDYILLRDYTDADKWLTKATQWSPDNALYWYYLGRTKNNEFQFKDAVEAFRQCLKLHPLDIRAEYNLGLAYAGLARNDDAALAYRTAIEWQASDVRRDPQPYLDMGELLLAEEKPGEAIPYLQQASVLDGKNPTFHEQLARAYERTGNLKAAETEFNRAITLAPNVPALHYQLGRVYGKEGVADKAKEEFARYAALNSTQASDLTGTPNPTSND